MRYIESCEVNVLSMHPIIYKSSLRKYARKLLEETALRTPKSANSSGYATFTSASTSTDSAIGKRKRSLPTRDTAEKPESPGLVPGSPSRHIETAVILAALALGKLSLHRGEITDVTPSKLNGSPIVHTGHPASPAYTSSLAHSESSEFMSPRESGSSRRQSLQSSACGVPPKPALSKKRNYDYLPGLEYLGPATDIMGNQDGAITIQHIQANLLIALYYGQIGYVVQSHKYICNASWTLQVYMRRDLPRLQKNHDYLMEINTAGPPPKNKPNDDLLLMTFWSCVQLER
jgi:hypothetical protein